MLMVQEAYKKCIKMVGENMNNHFGKCHSNEEIGHLSKWLCHFKAGISSCAMGDEILLHLLLRVAYLEPCSRY